MLETVAERFLAERAVPLMPDGEARETGEAFRRRDGRLMPAGSYTRMLWTGLRKKVAYLPGC